MDITTPYRVEPHKNGKGTAQLRIQVYVNGEPGSESVFLSGDEADIQEFVDGKIDLAEIRRRWGFRPKD